MYSIVLAGGSGTRLWPLSRAGHPKFLHALTGTDRSLLQTTVDRVRDLSPADRTYVVTGTAHVAAVSRQLPEVPEGNILVEPAPRDSCAAIAWAVATIARREPDAILAVFPADHLIGDQKRFEEIVRQAARVAEQGYLTTLGIRPTRAEVGYGYLRLGTEIGDGAFQLSEFKEKPKLEIAEEYVASGEYLWNAGMFVFRATAFLDELAVQRPELHAGIMRIAEAGDPDAVSAGAAAHGAPDAHDVLCEVWPTLEKISVDFAVMEGAAARGRVATVPADFPWSDVGDFHSLGESLDCDDDGNLVIGEPAAAILRDARSTVVVSTTDRVIATIGVEDLIVVDTADAVLVCPRSRAGEVKQIIDDLRELGLEARV